MAGKELIEVTLKNKSGVLKCSPQTLKLIRAKFSVLNPNYMQRRFDPRKYVITPTGAFQIGLWNELNNFIRSLAIPIELKVSQEFSEAFQPPWDVDLSEIQDIEGFNYYDYQRSAIEKFIEHGRGIGLLATSAGKGLIISGLCKTFLEVKPDAKILVIVPDVGLLNQLSKEFTKDFKLPSVTKWGDKQLPDWDANILVANSQILLSDIPYSLKKLQDYDMVVVDEVHTLGERSNKINKIVHGIHTNHKFGVTGTLPDNLLAAWNVLGKIGPILIVESSYNIRQKGTAAEVKSKMIYCVHEGSPDAPDPEDTSPAARYNMEKKFLQESPERNRVICDIATKLKGNVLILVDNIDYGLELERLLTGGKKTVYFIRGSVKTDRREEIKTLMENNSDIICIAISQIFSRGISIKNLKYAIFTAIGTSNVRVCQAIGRLMRLHDDKDCSYIFDICDNQEYSRKHMKDRVRMYKKEKIQYDVKKVIL